MRPIFVPLAMAVSALAAIPVASWSSAPDFDVKGRWAFAGKACPDADQFVEFDGRDILGSDAKAAPARVAENYSATLADGRLVVSLTDAASRDTDRWSFVVEGRDTMRLERAFFARDGLMKLTRCPTGV